MEQTIIPTLIHALGAIPGGGTIAAGLLWLVKKDELYEVDIEGRKALNFQITFFVIEMIVAWFSGTIAGGIHIFVIIFSLLAAYKTFNKENFEYPFSFKLL